MSEIKCVYSFCYIYVVLFVFELWSYFFFKLFINVFVIVFVMVNVLMKYVMKNVFNVFVNKGFFKY